jgi:hypothetical protein
MGEQKKHIDIKQHNNDLQFIKYTYYTLSDIDGFLSHLLNKKRLHKAAFFINTR